MMVHLKMFAVIFVAYRVAVTINIIGLQNVLNFCRQMTKLDVSLALAVVGCRIKFGTHVVPSFSNSH